MSRAIDNAEGFINLVLMVVFLAIAFLIYSQWKGLTIPGVGDLLKLMKDWLAGLFGKLDSGSSTVPSNGDPGTRNSGAQIQTGISNQYPSTYAPGGPDDWTNYGDFQVQPDGALTQ